MPTKMKSRTSRLRHLLQRAALACGTLLVAATADATPYASGLTNTGTQIIFRLNEAADSVKVVYNGGANTNDLGARPAGLVTNTVSIVGPYSVEVSQNFTLGYKHGTARRISNDSSVFVGYNSPRGVAVNKNPASPYFGTVYVANSAAGGSGQTAKGDGLFILGADLTPPTGLATNFFTAGLATSFSVGGASSPARIDVGEDGFLYVGDFSTATGTVYQVTPDLALSTNIFTGAGASASAIATNGHGSFLGSIVAMGSMATGNLTVYANDTDKPPINGLRRYDFGAGPLPLSPLAASNAPVLASNILQVAGVTVDLERGPDGTFYMSQRRAAGAEAGIYVYKTNAVTGDFELVWDSLGASLLEGTNTVDVLLETGAIAVSPDGKWLVSHLFGAAASDTWVIPLVDGIPDFAKRVRLDTGAISAGRDVGFDAAGNFYTISSGDARLRVWSPGGTTFTRTTSAGTFEVVDNSPTDNVTVVATQPVGNEQGTVPITFTITKTGSTASPAVVAYTLTGTATNGTDYVTNILTATIPAGFSSVDITVTPIDDSISEAGETVILTMLPSASAVPGIPASAQGVILDNDTPTISIAPVATTIYERVPEKHRAFLLTRIGNTNTDVSVNFTLTGTAVANTDYTIDPVTIPGGVTVANVFVTPIDNSVFSGDKRLTNTLTTGTGYALATTSTNAALTLVDDELGFERVLWSDNLDSTDSATNYAVLFGAVNGIQDYSLTFGSEYSFDGVVPAPGGTSTKGVRMTVNKDEATAEGAAGLNLYVTNATFSGDYALRFNMHASVGLGGSTTESVTFGINHSGTKTNFVTQNTDTTLATRGGDGIWFSIEMEAGGSINYGAWRSINNVQTAITNRANTAFTNLFQSPPFYDVNQSGGVNIEGGSPSFAGDSLNKFWVDVEVRQSNNVVTLFINKATIFSFTNSFGLTNGTVMLGYNDQFNSVGPASQFVIYDNVRVVALNLVQPRITSTSVSGGVVTIDFAAANGDVSKMSLESSGGITSPSTIWATEQTAVITSTGPGTFRATIPVNGNPRFYRIKRQD